MFFLGKSFCCIAIVFRTSVIVTGTDNCYWNRYIYRDRGRDRYLSFFQIEMICALGLTLSGKGEYSEEKDKRVVEKINLGK